MTSKTNRRREPLRNPYVTQPYPPLGGLLWANMVASGTARARGRDLGDQGGRAQGIRIRILPAIYITRYTSEEGGIHEMRPKCRVTRPSRFLRTPPPVTNGSLNGKKPYM